MKPEVRPVSTNRVLTLPMRPKHFLIQIDSFGQANDTATAKIDSNYWAALLHVSLLWSTAARRVGVSGARRQLRSNGGPQSLNKLVNCSARIAQSESSLMDSFKKTLWLSVQIVASGSAQVSQAPAWSSMKAAIDEGSAGRPSCKNKSLMVWTGLCIWCPLL